MTLYEWLKLYHRKTGEYPNGWPCSDFKFEEEHGFCVYIPDGDILIIGEVCGDGLYWHKYLNRKAKELGCKTLRFWTKRNPVAFIRKYGYSLTGFVDGHHILEKEVF